MNAEGKQRSNIPVPGSIHPFEALLRHDWLEMYFKYSCNEATRLSIPRKNLDESNFLCIDAFETVSDPNPLL